MDKVEKAIADNNRYLLEKIENIAKWMEEIKREARAAREESNKSRKELLEKIEEQECRQEEMHRVNTKSIQELKDWQTESNAKKALYYVITSFIASIVGGAILIVFDKFII